MSLTGLRTRVVAPVLEVFASVQGEGAFMGEPQVLVRLRGCPLRCRFCDTPGSLKLDAPVRARVATPRGVRREPGWATPFQVACWVAEVEPGTPRTVSLTGGEPLMWPGFLLGLRAVLGPRRLHLETGGGHPQTLARVLEACDHVSLDLKLPADLAAPVPLEVPAEFLDPAQVCREASPRDEREWAAARARDLVAVRDRDAAGKLVVCGGRRAEDYVPIVVDVARLAPRLPLYVAPVTPRSGIEAPSLALLEQVVELVRDHGLAVRVVPQVHRLQGLP